MNTPVTFELLLDFSQRINQKEFQSLLMRTLDRANKSIRNLTEQDNVVSCLTDLRTWQLLQVFENEIEGDANFRDVWLAIKNKVSVDETSMEPVKFGFINHEDEIRYLLSPMTIAQYISIDAPAGYGKTYLLKHLQERFRTDMDWLCAYVPEEMTVDIYSVAKTIAVDLNISMDGITPRSSADILAQFLVRNLVKSECFAPPKSLAILLDVTKSLSSLEVQELFDGFIAKIQERLVASSAAFRNGMPCQFRVIVAERYATGVKDNFPIFDGTTLPFVRKQLTPFDFDVIRLSVRRHWQDKYDHNENDQIAAHLMFYTGGHPGFLVESLQFCSQQQGLTPDTIFEADEWKNWYSDHLVYWYGEVSKSIPSALLNIFQTVGVYRKLDYHILRALILKNKIDGYKNEYDLHDRLVATNLLRWNGRFLQDDITRRLIAIHVREESSETTYMEQCQEAESTYREALDNNNLKGFIQPENWIIEILFQGLQKNVDLIKSVSGRKKLASLFYEKYIPECLASLVSLPEDQRRIMWHSIRQTILDDWEFRFTLNYFLREQKFSLEPLREFNHRLDALWKK